VTSRTGEALSHPAVGGAAEASQRSRIEPDDVLELSRGGTTGEGPVVGARIRFDGHESEERRGGVRRFLAAFFAASFSPPRVDITAVDLFLACLSGRTTGVVDVDAAAVDVPVRDDPAVVISREFRPRLGG